jgi:K+-sensing histidine kinase KdpD
VIGGHIQVSTAVTDGKAILSLTNTGPVIPASDIDRLFQPFQQLDPRRGYYKEGHGLGLSIVRAIATTHEASITAHPMADGGFSVEVAFPPPDHARHDVHGTAPAQRSPTKVTKRARPVPEAEPAPQPLPPGRQSTVPSPSH